MMETRGMMMEAAGIVVAAAMLATVSNMVASPKRQLPWIADAATFTPAPAQTATVAPDSPVEGAAAAETPVEIGTELAYEEWSSGTIFLDARVSDLFYSEGRIANARSFAVWEGDVDSKVVDLMSEFPPTARMVTYCTGGACEDSHLLLNKLSAAGFTNVFVYMDGFPGWVDAGHPVEH
jgi:rhodanese-related sulfurtransferase